MGLGFMALAVLAQPVLQSLPTLFIVVGRLPSLVGKTPEEAGALVLGWLRPYVPWLVLYAGLVSGVCQEVARYFAVRGREPAASPYIGYGLALVDIAAALLSVAAAVLFPHRAGPSPSYVERWALELASYLGTVVQPVTSYLFHPGASVFLRAMQAEGRGAAGLVLTTAVHAYVNTCVGYLNAAGQGLIETTTDFFLLLSAVFFVGVLALPAALMRAGLAKMRRMRQTGASA